MSAEAPIRVAVVWRGNAEERATATADESRLRGVFGTLERHGAIVLPAVYSEEFEGECRDQLLGMDAVLAWVNPIADGRDRSQLDRLLREVAERGIWVSAHPDVILKMGTKEVLFRTRHMGWGSDCRLYRSHRELSEQLPMLLASGASRVLKQNRGNGGSGIWRVTLGSQHRAQAAALSLSPDMQIEVQHAVRGSAPEQITLAALLERCRPYFAGDGCMLDQPFEPRAAEGMIRCYLVHDRVAGFGHQLIKALLPPPADGPESEAAQPGPRLYSGALDPRFQRLRHTMETEWVPGLQNVLDIDTDSLPAIWDADFLYGPKSASGEDTYVLCEINVSSVFPFPDEALDEIATAVIERARAARAKRERLASRTHS